MPISEDHRLIKPGVDKASITKWIKCIDHETPKSIAIDRLSSRIFILTEKGFFSVWHLKSFDMIFEKPFYKQARAIIAFKLTARILLVFENEVVVLDQNEEQGFDELPEYNLKTNTISDAKLNHNETLLGVATTSAAAPEVTLYKIKKKGFKMYKHLVGFKATIKYIDFSTDNYYLQCEDNLGESLLVEIESQRVIHTETGTFELEWLGEGLRSFS